MRLSGSITALATPFTASGDLDLDAWRRLLHSQLAGGTAAVVVAGSTGEGAALSESEFEQLLQAAVDVVAGRLPVLAGTGASDTARTVAQTRRAAALGAAAALVSTPAYVRPTQGGLLAHFRAVADEGGLPVVLYNVPARTGCDLLPETVAALSAHPRIAGIKEASTDPARLRALLALRDAHFMVLGGDDATALRALRDGADGIVSAVSNLVPLAFAQLCALARTDRLAEAEALDRALQRLASFLSVEPNPIPLKALLRHRGIGCDPRLPLTPLSVEYAAGAARIADEIIELERSGRELHAA